VLDLRDRGAIDDEVMRRVQRDLDYEAMVMESPDPVAETPEEIGESIDAP
jgi:hypothetical protein